MLADIKGPSSALQIGQLGPQHRPKEAQDRDLVFQTSPQGLDNEDIDLLTCPKSFHVSLAKRNRARTAGIGRRGRRLGHASGLARRERSSPCRTRGAADRAPGLAHPHGLVRRRLSRQDHIALVAATRGLLRGRSQSPADEHRATSLLQVHGKLDPGEEPQAGEGPADRSVDAPQVA